MDGVDDMLPSGQRRLAVEQWNPAIVAGCGPVDDGALGQDQPDLSLRATAVIGDVRFTGNAVGRKEATRPCLHREMNPRGYQR